MAVNSSSSSNDFLPHPYMPSGMGCLFTRPSSIIFAAYSVVNILLLLPLCILILYLGLQRWQKQRSTSTAAMTSHSDTFTYHMVVMELLGVFGFTLCCCGIYKDHVTIFMVGYFLWCLIWHGETFFHVLTCLERYLAVVHPVTYLSLRRERGVRIRNITIGCIWLLCFGAASLAISSDNFLLVDFCLLILSLIIVAFCSLSVLCVLIRPGPGEQGGDRERVDQSKRRAFYTIVAILGVLLLRFCGNLIWYALNVLTERSECVMAIFEVWFNVPSILVLPLLFIHKAGILACCKKNTK